MNHACSEKKKVTIKTFFELYSQGGGRKIHNQAKQRSRFYRAQFERAMKPWFQVARASAAARPATSPSPGARNASWVLLHRGRPRSSLKRGRSDKSTLSIFRNKTIPEIAIAWALEAWTTTHHIHPDLNHLLPGNTRA
jgi:hypothetical protein